MTIAAKSTVGLDGAVGSKSHANFTLDGLICDSNSKSLKDAIEFLMRNKETREKFGNLAREKIINENSLENYQAVVVVFYRGHF